MRTQMLAASLSAVALVSSGVTAAEEPALSVGANLSGGLELEFQVDRFGISLSQLRGAEEFVFEFNGTTLCSEELDRNFLMLRRMPKSDIGGVYFGLGLFNEKIRSGANGGCGFFEVENGALPVVGYRTASQDGFYFDLGLRPGLAGFGIAKSF